MYTPHLLQMILVRPTGFVTYLISGRPKHKLAKHALSIYSSIEPLQGII